MKRKIAYMLLKYVPEIHMTTLIAKKMLKRQCVIYLIPRYSYKLG